jgi:hypothetical protein
MTVVYQASIWYRAEKPYGIGRTANERHSYIVPGYRGEIISGLPDGRAVYTGVCSTRDEVKAELVEHLKRLGYHGSLRVA